MSTEKLNRRKFAGMLAAGTAVPLAALAHAQEPKPAEPKETKAQPPANDQPEPAPEPVPRDALLLEVVKQTYPDRLEPEHLEFIRWEFAHILGRSKALASFPLSNGDGPGFVFRAFRGPDVPKKV